MEHYISIVFAVWFFIGGVISLVKKLPSFRKIVVARGQIVDWIKRYDHLGIPNYIPVVEYLDKVKNELVKKSLVKDSMPGLFFRRKAKILIVIDQLGNAQALFSSVAELLLPIGFIIFAIILLGQIQLVQIL